MKQKGIYSMCKSFTKKKKDGDLGVLKMVQTFMGFTCILDRIWHYALQEIVWM